MSPRLPAVSPSAYRRVTLCALVALGFIVVTGGAVRLTGSGLGCPDWPTCDRSQVIRVVPSDFHATVESVNRTITGVVSVFVMLAVLGSVFRRPRRRDLVWLSLGLVAGVIGQIVLGGLTVIFELRPELVMAHFLVSMVLIANAVVLHERAGRDEGRWVPIGRREVMALGRLVVVAAGLVLLLGTVVTSSGPHGGDDRAERFPFLVSDVARLHGLAAFLLLAVTLGALWRLWQLGVVPALIRRAEVLLAVLVGQGVVGYVQYFTGVPALLVGVHIAGAAATWAAAVRFQQAFWVPASMH
ncbi:MAG: COX15/CtaA family protein [Acidimicrobiales bacterium]